MTRRAPSVRFTLRMSVEMRARIVRFARELALPTDADLVLIAVAEYLDRLIALRGQAYVSIPEELRRRELRTPAAVERATVPARPRSPRALARDVEAERQRKLALEGISDADMAAHGHPVKVYPAARPRRAR